MNYLFFAIASAFFLGIYNFFIKLSSGHINEIVGAVVLQIVAALFGGIILLILKTQGHSMEISSKGFLFAAIAGLSIGLAEITSFMAFSRGAPASIGISVIIGGAVIVGTVLGLVFLKELLNLQQFFAILLIFIGVIILAK